MCSLIPGVQTGYEYPLHQRSGAPARPGGSVGEGNPAGAAAASRAPSTTSTMGSFQVTDAVMNTDAPSRTPSVASTGRSWENIPSETTTMRQGLYTPVPKAKAQPSASSSSRATPSGTAVTAVTLVALFGPTKADKLHDTAFSGQSTDQMFAYFILFHNIVLFRLREAFDT